MPLNRTPRGQGERLVLADAIAGEKGGSRGGTQIKIKKMMRKRTKILV